MMVRRVNDQIESTAQALANLGSGHLFLSEEMALQGNTEFREAVLNRVNLIRGEKESQKRKELQMMADREILSRNRPTLVIEDNTDIELNEVESDLEKETILVVDDSQTDLAVLGGHLKLHQADTLLASSWEEALNILENHSPDAIFVDLIMPEVDGFKLNEMIRALNKYSSDKPTIIAYSGKELNFDEKELIRTNFNNFLAKPLNPARLTEILRKTGA